jgi:nitroimidazol reductase NimA-like FMN-containing flavoprotein (pyridoxamine 5'-phosphate oxidase superfamily)
MQTIRDIIRENSFCVLATCSEDKPHCSLMSYAADDGCREIYMITLSDTQKFRNISMNPTVSLLIDSRTDPTHTVQALTLGGKIQSVTDPDKKERIGRILLEVRPELKELIESSEAIFLSMQIESTQLFEGQKRVGIEI